MRYIVKYFFIREWELIQCVISLCGFPFSRFTSSILKHLILGKAKQMATIVIFVLSKWRARIWNHSVFYFLKEWCRHVYKTGKNTSFLSCGILKSIKHNKLPIIHCNAILMKSLDKGHTPDKHGTFAFLVDVFIFIYTLCIYLYSGSGLKKIKLKKM